MPAHAPESIALKSARHILPSIAAVAALRFVAVSFSFSISGALALLACLLAIAVHYSIDSASGPAGSKGRGGVADSKARSASPKSDRNAVMSASGHKHPAQDQDQDVAHDPDQDPGTALDARLMQSDPLLESWLNRSGMDLLYNAFDPSQCDALRAFAHVKASSQCLFARKSRLWGSRNWDDTVSLDTNIYRSVPMFMQFCQALAADVPLDGFLVAIPAGRYGSTVDDFAATVNRVLRVLSTYDPAGVRIMARSYVGLRGWAFEFAHEPFFVTTFAPFYPPNHSRFAFGASWSSADSAADAADTEPSPARLAEKYCYIMFQPERSFARHNIGDDTPVTNWDSPATVRDRIRVSFANAGRAYVVPPSIHYPTANHIVEAVNVHEDPVVEFWRKEPCW